MGSLAGKVAIVTGSSRGIGRAAALELARQGADITINYRSHREEGEAVAAEVRAMGRRALAVACDVAHRDQIEAMVQQTVGELGRLDIMVSNAISSRRGSILDISAEDVAHTWTHALWASFHCAQLAARQMVKQGGGGKICFVGSVHATVAEPGTMAYSTAKAGVNQMMKVIAADLAPHGIHVNAIEPGWIDTPGERQFATEEELQEAGKVLPLGRLGRAEECGKAIAYLCSPDADYMTGTVLLIDGGYLLPAWRHGAS